MEGTNSLYKEAYGRVVKISPEFRATAEKEIRIITEFVNKKATILDVGCGFGRAMKTLAPLCKTIMGIDSDPREIESARRYLEGINNSILFVRNARETHFRNESFDVILFLGNTFGNISEEKEDVMREMRRILKKNGKRFIEVNRRESVMERAEAFNRIGMKVKDIEDGRICIEGGLISECFTEEELENAVSACNWEGGYIDVGGKSLFCVLVRE